MVFKNLLLLSSSFTQNLQNHVYMVVCEYTCMPVCFMLSQSVFVSFSLLSSLPPFLLLSLLFSERRYILSLFFFFFVFYLQNFPVSLTTSYKNLLLSSFFQIEKIYIVLVKKSISGYSAIKWQNCNQEFNLPILKLEKDMATHSSILAQRTLWTEEPGGLPSMGLHTRLKRLSMHACIGEGNGNPLQCSCLENPRGSLVGCRLWGRTESDTTEVN